MYENDARDPTADLGLRKPVAVTLRGDIAEVASGEANSRPAFERVLEGYDIEVDGELKIAASIYYHRYLTRTSNGPSAAHLNNLVDALHAVGPDLDERRAAAFAGMLLLGRVNDIAPMMEYGDKPLHIRSGTGYGNESDSLMALMCERWEDVRRAFGADLGDEASKLQRCVGFIAKGQEVSARGRRRIDVSSPESSRPARCSSTIVGGCSGEK